VLILYKGVSSQQKEAHITLNKHVVKRWASLFYFILIIVMALPLPIHSAQRSNPDDLELSGELKNGVREITVGAYKYGFFPNPMVVKHGEKIRLLMTAADVPHGIRITEFNVNTMLPLGVTKAIEFTASQKGEFMVHCSVYCGPNHGKQKSRLIVR
jgi:cytochrome c oxidase subunit II